MITQGYMEYKCEDILEGVVTFEQDHIAKSRLCNIARHPEKLLLESETALIDHLLTVFRRFTICEATKIGRIFIRKAKEAGIVHEVVVEARIESVFSEDNENKGWFSDEELKELNKADGV